MEMGRTAEAPHRYYNVYSEHINCLVLKEAEHFGSGDV